MKTTISGKGQLVLPPEIREQDDIEPSQEGNGASGRMTRGLAPGLF
ncbi:MAG TPA: AbrB/MazE/SpoVT family DNA-binding domain-containing protein [Vicinamibacteria bacterium]|nr:AbrB/MazE/SpoVT family DNA-binding domain-containing protein [Vicinamibacteria bacterium]